MRTLGLTTLVLLAVFIAIMALGASVDRPPQQSAWSDSDHQLFASAIRLANYECDYVSIGFKARRTHRGREVKVQCEGGAFLYRIVRRPDGSFLVEPR